ncbi:related to USO1 - intracellular protein transport protein [Cephalotrichum gorgonifer]|uniref:Related to USO1 - intracellular protein transport protein n=1 Tax=Cephalotrichum gorgonifer TaxID=2041049 RepID=A0AAE8MR91_9PEZI|nr:related to USO1 - intracellular protein transport protein [Cephalotrichum gorgonifer]
MADIDEKAKAERRAAVKKKARADALKKKQQQGGKKEAKAKAEKTEDPNPDETTAAELEKADVAVEDAADETPEQPTSPTTGATSMAEQSKIRSSSFRKGSVSSPPGPLSPGLGSAEGVTAPEIYRKQVARIEELERETERLARSNAEAEKRWKKAEEALEESRDADGASGNKAAASDEVEKLRSENTALQRHNAQLQQQVSRSGSKPSKESSASEWEERYISKAATMEIMELEMSKLRAALERGPSEKEQVAALEQKLERAERAASSAQQELQDLRRNLDRTAEKAVRDSSERTSVETKLRTVQHELADQLAARADLETKVDALEKKATTLTTLHREQDSRTQALKREKERAEATVKELTAKVDHLEAEVAKLKGRRSTDGGIDDDAVDELADEGRQKLEKRIRELESENYELRSGIWKDKRRELQEGEASASFQDVDLGGPGVTSPGHRKQGGGFGEFIASGIHALTGTDDGGFLDDDDDLDFDEDAFKRAQAEEASKRLERVKEVKRGLKNWAGWRLDLVDSRRGGGGMGEIFEI